MVGIFGAVATLSAGLAVIQASVSNKIKRIDVADLLNVVMKPQ
jgi:hypothetical protein